MRCVWVILAVATVGCSTIVEGTSQEIVVNTNPSGASCDLIREGVSIAKVGPTPGTATVRKTKHDIAIECELAGYHKATYYNKSDVAGATFGNILLGGVVGWGIDSAAGADNKYETPVNINLVPLTAAASNAPTKPAESAGGTVAPTDANP